MVFLRAYNPVSPTSWRSESQSEPGERRHSSMGLMEVQRMDGGLPVPAVVDGVDAMDAVAARPRDAREFLQGGVHVG